MAAPARGGAGAEDSSDDEPEQLQYKVILLGDGAVGKTSIAARFTNDYFSKMYKQTIGLDFFIKRLVLPGDIHVALQIWDIGGQSIGGKMIKNYIYGAQAVLLCYDVTNYASFQNLEDWYRLVQQTHAADAMPYVALVGNKTDLNHMRAVKLDKHNLFSDENDMYSYFMSAKTGDSVASSFYRIAADLAGVVLTKPEIEVESKVVKAELVNHQRNDPAVEEPDSAKVGGKGRKRGGGGGKCAVM
uniref:Ras-related protein Rab-28 n=1 Tax=Bicosoecida sp. CB-2014 TaxID=1486930 RepID=A0A7S1CBI3_9STRA|mmetsp:Transcript_18870/g.66688  ORF Transcript_18870/g.66688 Transcript_18870/m.66688 type:complete len:244 (+) Transcript_18870:377-1108(+)